MKDWCPLKELHFADKFLDQVYVGKGTTVQDVKDAVDYLSSELAKLRKIYAHTHVAKYIKVDEADVLTDECAVCGLDLRNPIHRRINDTESL